MDRTVLDNYTSLFLNKKGQISGYYEIFISTVNDILSSELLWILLLSQQKQKVSINNILYTWVLYTIPQ